jgi:hypothetical protein
MVDDCLASRPHVVDNKEVECKRAIPREGMQQALPELHVTSKKLFVGSLKEDIQEEDLQQYFSQFGTIASVDITKDRNTGQRRGFGFVTFNDYDPVDKVILLGNHEIKGHPIAIKKALEREQKEMLASGIPMRGGHVGGGPVRGARGVPGRGGRGGARGGAAAVGGYYNGAGGYGAGYGADSYGAGSGYSDSWGQGAMGAGAGGGWGQGGMTAVGSWGGQGGGYGDQYGPGYGGGYGGGAMKGPGYSQRATGPYGGGFGRGAGGAVAAPSAGGYGGAPTPVPPPAARGGYGGAPSYNAGYGAR